MTKSEWRPIETIPTDGTAVLVFWRFDNGTRVVSIGSATRGRDGTIGVWSEGTAGTLAQYLLHTARWVPLPEPPEED